MSELEQVLMIFGGGRTYGIGILLFLAVSYECFEGPVHVGLYLLPVGQECVWVVPELFLLLRGVVEVRGSLCFRIYEALRRGDPCG